MSLEGVLGTHPSGMRGGVKARRTAPGWRDCLAPGGVAGLSSQAMTPSSCINIHTVVAKTSETNPAKSSIISFCAKKCMCCKGKPFLLLPNL